MAVPYSKATSSSIVLSGHLRIATFAIALFDCIQTIPGEYQLYKRQFRNKRLSAICCLFIVVRYVSIICLVLNGVGFYSKDFNQESCDRFYLAPVMTKMIAGLACQGIILSRTYAISRGRRTLAGLCALCILVFPLQMIGNIYKRHPAVGTGEIDKGNCIARRYAGEFNSAPLYYLANLIFDVVACGIATCSLLRRESIGGKRSAFVKRVLNHGLLFAFGATATNLVVFMALMEVPGFRSLGAFFSVAATMIFAQHLVLATTDTPTESVDFLSTWEVRQRTAAQDLSDRWTIGGTTMATSSSGNPTQISARRPTAHSASYLDGIELGGRSIQTDITPHVVDAENGTQLSTVMGQRSRMGSINKPLEAHESPSTSGGMSDVEDGRWSQKPPDDEKRVS